jgi:hypothetical protein
MVPRILLLGALLCAQAAHAIADDRAVLIYPRERSWFRRVFYTSHQRQLVRQLASRYRVDVHEQIANDDALFAVDVDGARLLVISGHGDAFSMHMAGRARRTLDSTDRLALERFFDRLAPDATILLQSCHTGRGFAHVVKAAAGPMRRVIAAKGEIPWNGVAVTSLQPFDARILCDDHGLWDCTVRF